MPLSPIAVMLHKRFGTQLAEANKKRSEKGTSRIHPVIKDNLGKSLPYTGPEQPTPEQVRRRFYIVPRESPRDIPPGGITMNDRNVLSSKKLDDILKEEGVDPQTRLRIIARAIPFDDGENAEGAPVADDKPDNTSQPSKVRHISLDEGVKGLKSFFESLGVSVETRQDESALAQAALIAAKAIVVGRIRWDQRAEHEELRQLKNAPLFLRKVYGDFLESNLRLPDGRSVWHLHLPDGQPVWQEAIRINDATLVQIVQDYVNKRDRRSHDLGDAEGLVFAKKDNRGRPRKPSSSGRKGPEGSHRRLG